MTKAAASSQKNPAAGAEGNVVREANGPGTEDRLGELKLSLREISLGGKTFELWTPSVAEDVLEASISKVHDNPYWATIWPAAERMTAFVAEHLPSNISVLELGCGTGVVGIAVLSEGGRVTFNDVVPEAVQLSLRNARQNDFERCDGTAFDWASPPEHASYDFIIGSDLLYETASHAPLLLTLQKLLTDHGEAWIADMGRQNAVELVNNLDPSRWSVTTVDEQGRRTAPSLGCFQVFKIRRPDRHLC